MSTPILIARIGAIIYLSVSLGILLNTAHFRQIIDDFVKSPGASYLASMLALIVGCLMVSAYNVWNYDWTILIPILGWGAILKGTLGLIFPAQTLTLSHRLAKTISFPILAAVSLVLGLVLAYYGFVVV